MHKRRHRGRFKRLGSDGLTPFKPNMMGPLQPVPSHRAPLLRDGLLEHAPKSASRVHGIGCPSAIRDARWREPPGLGVKGSRGRG